MKNHIFTAWDLYSPSLSLRKHCLGRVSKLFVCFFAWEDGAPHHQKNSLVFTCGFLWSSNPWEDWGRVLLFLSVSRVRYKSTLTWPPKNHFGARQSSPLVVHEAISVWRSIISNAWFSLFSIFFGYFLNFLGLAGFEQRSISFSSLETFGGDGAKNVCELWTSDVFLLLYSRRLPVPLDLKVSGKHPSSPMTQQLGHFI